MKTLFFDIDTQLDFVYPAGSLYVPNAELIVPRVARLNRYAAAQGWPLISTSDAHAENDVEFRLWPPHCVSGTQGQTKPLDTVAMPCVRVPRPRSDFALPNGTQVILEKTSVNCFTNENISAVLAHYDAQRYVVYGVVTEICVAFATKGLLQLGNRVELVSDAVMHLDSVARDRMLADFVHGGGVITTTNQVCRVN
ncbi:MAG: isochorismatase family cysteine hydrolase [Bryobacteraceae bacterium]